MAHIITVPALAPGGVQVTDTDERGEALLCVTAPAPQPALSPAATASTATKLPPRLAVPSDVAAASIGANRKPIHDVDEPAKVTVYVRPAVHVDDGSPVATSSSVAVRSDGAAASEPCPGAQPQLAATQFERAHAKAGRLAPSKSRTSTSRCENISMSRTGAARGYAGWKPARRAARTNETTQLHSQK